MSWLYKQSGCSVLFTREYYRRRYVSGEISFHTWTNALSQIESFGHFLNRANPGAAVEYVDAALLQDYRRYCLESGNLPSTVGRKLGFPFPLGMHVARHTFAVKALNSARLDVHLISRLLGHSSVTVTEKVYATFLLPTLSAEVRSRLSFPEFGAKNDG